MAKLKNVEDSMMGEQQMFANDISNEMSQIAVQDSFKPVDEYVIYKLVKTNRKGRVYIDGIDDVINPKTITDKNKNGSMERIFISTS